MTTFGFQIPGFRHAGAADGEMFDQTLAHALAAEESGFASVWVMDHFWQLPALGGVGFAVGPFDGVAGVFGSPAALRRALAALAATI